MPTLLGILVRPVSALRGLRDRPRWLFPFCVLAALQVCLVVAAQQQTIDSVLSHLPGSATAADREVVRGMLSEGLVVGLLFQPIRLLIGWSAFAGTLFALVRSLKLPDPASYLRLLALEVHAESILILAGAAALICGTLCGPPSGAPPLSAALFFTPGTSFPLFSLLRSLNIFTLWYVAVLAAGIRVLCGLTLRNAVLVAAGAWALSVLFDIGILTLLISTLHLQV